VPYVDHRPHPPQTPVLGCIHCFKQCEIVVSQILLYGAQPGAKKDLTDTGDDFLAIGLALRIMQLNVEGLSAAKREVISSIAERQKIDVICLEETHVDVDKTNRFSIAGFDLLTYCTR